MSVRALAVYAAAQQGYSVSSTDGRVQAQAAPGHAFVHVCHTLGKGEPVTCTLIVEHSWAALYARLEQVIHAPHKEVIHGSAAN